MRSYRGQMTRILDKEEELEYMERIRYNDANEGKSASDEDRKSDWIATKKYTTACHSETRDKEIKA